jgi:hypothetical protein
MGALKIFFVYVCFNIKKRRFTSLQSRLYKYLWSVYLCGNINISLQVRLLFPETGVCVTRSKSRVGYFRSIYT